MGNDLSNLNMPVVPMRELLIVALVFIVAATVIILALLVRKMNDGSKHIGTMITMLATLLSAAGGYVLNQPKVEALETKLKNANQALDAFEKEVAKEVMNPMLTPTGGATTTSGTSP